jgi:hypothetical protein
VQADRTAWHALYYATLRGYTFSNMLRVASWGWWHDARDERELVRLDVVGLAAQVATVARHIDVALAPIGVHRRTDEVRAQCRSMLQMALLVLSADTCLEEISAEDLFEALDVFRDLQRKIVRLRDEAEHLGDSVLPFA